MRGKKMKKKGLFKMLLCLSLISASIFPMSSNAFATSKEDVSKISQQGVYTQEEVDAQWEIARNKPIQPDKDVKVVKDKDNLSSETEISTNALASTTSTGIYPTRAGMILVTPDAYKNLIPTGHAGIIMGSTWVIESLSNGVVSGPNDWNTTKTKCYGVSVNGTTVKQDYDAANWCANKSGTAYNYNYLDPYTRTKFYCSQLVYASFLDLYGIDLNTSAFLQAVHPMELVNSSNTSTVYQN
jgi:uncharacterized protein YycO